MLSTKNSAGEDPIVGLAGYQASAVPLARNARVRTAGSSAATEDAGRDSGSQVGNAALAEADMGLPFYPGSRVQPDLSVLIVDPAGAQTRSVTLVTTDSPQKVEAFYRGRPPREGSEIEVHEAAEGGAWAWRSTSADGQNLGVTVIGDADSTRVVLVRQVPTNAAARR